MSSIPSTVRFIEFQTGTASMARADAPVRGILVEIQTDGRLVVRYLDGRDFLCDWLEGPATANIRLEPGDCLLVTPPADGQPGVVLGRIGRYREPQPEARVTIEATETLTLRCGESSVDLRADGKVMVRGQDVLLRAKGTQRIRAGNVAIN